MLLISKHDNNPRVVEIHLHSISYHQAASYLLLQRVNKGYSLKTITAII